MVVHTLLSSASLSWSQSNPDQVGTYVGMIRRHGWWIKAHEINCAIFLIYYCRRILQERKSSKRTIKEGERKKKKKTRCKVGGSVGEYLT